MSFLIMLKTFLIQFKIIAFIINIYFYNLFLIFVQYHYQFKLKKFQTFLLYLQHLFFPINSNLIKIYKILIKK